MFYCLNIIFSWICLPNSSKNSLSYSNFSHSKYNNNTVFEGINNTEKSRALNSHNAQIKQRYYYYNSFKRCCVFLRVLCFALFNQIVQILVTKFRILRQGRGDPHIKSILLFWFLTATFFVFQIQCFCFYHLFMFFSLQQTKHRHHIAKFSGR